MSLYYVATAAPKRLSQLRKDDWGVPYIYLGTKPGAFSFVRRNPGQGYKVYQIEFVEISRRTP